MKFIEKCNYIEATQWFRNGDHPKDFDGLLEKSGEGLVVRYFRMPGISNNTNCVSCNIIMKWHGWLSLSGDFRPKVCPGDWIITDKIFNGEGFSSETYHRCGPEMFSNTYELLEDVLYNNIELKENK